MTREPWQWSEKGQLRVAKEFRERKKPENYISLENLTLKADIPTMIQISLNLPFNFIVGLDLLVHDKLYPTRAEAIREAVRDFLRENHPRVWDTLWQVENIKGV